MFQGSIVALITPMNRQGKVCWLSLKKLINYHISNGTSAIVSTGTTGESATLSYNERINVVMTTLEFAEGRIPIIAGIGANSTLETINLAKSFKGCGIVAFLTVAPYYNFPTQEGLFLHFKSIAENTDIPQILYNIPSRTGCDILPETVGRLSKIKNIIGIKESTGNLSRVHLIRELTSEKFILLSGHDATALDFIQLGGNGVISVTANVAARDMAEKCKLAISKSYKEARLINRRLMRLHNALFLEPNPIPIKWACRKLGLIKTNKLRLPMTPITNRSRKMIISALSHANLL